MERWNVLMASKFRFLERVMRGAANHRRIQILTLLDHHPGLNLRQIATLLRIKGNTAGEHTRRLFISGLITKRSKGRDVLHELSPAGMKMLAFLRTME